MVDKKVSFGSILKPSFDSDTGNDWDNWTSANFLFSDSHRLTHNPATKWSTACRSPNWNLLIISRRASHFTFNAFTALSESASNLVKYERHNHKLQWVSSLRLQGRHALNPILRTEVLKTNSRLEVQCLSVVSTESGHSMDSEDTSPPSNCSSPLHGYNLYKDTIVQAPAPAAKPKNLMPGWYNDKQRNAKTCLRTVATLGRGCYDKYSRDNTFPWGKKDIDKLELSIKSFWTVILGPFHFSSSRWTCQTRRPAGSASSLNQGTLQRSYRNRLDLDFGDFLSQLAGTNF